MPSTSSNEALLETTTTTTAPPEEDGAAGGCVPDWIPDWDDETGNSQGDGEGQGESTGGGDGQTPGDRGSEEEQAAGDGWKPPRIPRAIMTEYPVHLLRDSISITLDLRRTSRLFSRGVSKEAWMAMAREVNRAHGQQPQGPVTGLRPEEESWWGLIRQANGLRDEPRAMAVTPDRDAFYVLRASDLNTFVRNNIDKHLRLMDYISSYWAQDPNTPQSAAPLYAIVTLALQHFTNHQPHALARILSAPLVAPSKGKTGLDVARTMERPGFAFFPRDVVNWHELRLQDWTKDQVPQLVIRARRLEAASLRQSRHLIDQAVSLATSSHIQTREQAEDILSILSQLLVHSYKEAAYLALFPPARGGRRRVADMNTFEFSLTSIQARSRAIQGRELWYFRPPANHRFRIKSVLTYFEWAWTLAHSDISRRHTDSLYFRLEAIRTIRAFEELRHSPHVSAQSFLCILYYRFCQQVLYFPNPDHINGVLSSRDMLLSIDDARSIVIRPSSAVRAMILS
ncbi:hypothetical protein FPRO04_14552 [Fusarium proliferatum]|nr:hypothetical protein FPRO04_14552 [Fusarium proliferatum]